MSTALFTLASSLHSEVMEKVENESFIVDIEKALGEKFLIQGNDFSSFGSHDQDIIYVRTGGTEGMFKSLGIQDNVRLLTSGDSNSLAASMEILSYLRRRGKRGEILHGSSQYIADRIKNANNSACGNGSRFIQKLDRIDLGGIRLGVIGKPSDWLIASDVDYGTAKHTLNAEIVDIPMEELLTRIDCPDTKSFEGSVAIYDALKGLIREYGLQGLSLRCFDLLDRVQNTGCLALARLNAEGIPSSCEGDIPALLTMAYLQKTRGCPGFQCNLSRINENNLLFAHCSVPLSMLSSYKYATHFESNIGTAIKGEMIPGDVEIIKISPDLRSFVRIPGKLIENTSLPNLCRTQIIVNAPGAAEYLLNYSLANHHIISYK